MADGTAAKRRQRQEILGAAGGWVRGSVSGAANTVNRVGRAGMMEEEEEDGDEVEDGENRTRVKNEGSQGVER